MNTNAVPVSQTTIGNVTVGDVAVSSANGMVTIDNRDTIIGGDREIISVLAANGEVRDISYRFGLIIACQ